MSSGLEQLTAQRERSTRRSMPPPRNPPRATPVEIPTDAERAAVATTGHPAVEPSLTESNAKPPAVGPSLPATAKSEPTAPAPRPALTGQPAVVKSSPRPAKAAAPVAESFGPEDDLAKYSIYFDGTADEFLEATRVAGRRLKPKLAISRSSVVRLALERLSDAMSPDEVAAELSRNAAIARTSTGRPRL